MLNFSLVRWKSFGFYKEATSLEAFKRSQIFPEGKDSGDFKAFFKKKAQ